MTSRTSGCLFNYLPTPLRDDSCYFLILRRVCSQNLILQCSITLLASDCLTSRILIPWENLYCTLLTTGTFSLSIATWCPICFLTNSMISCVIKTSHEPSDYENPKLYGQHPCHFFLFWWCHEVSSPFITTLLPWWPSSIAALRRALLSNHCCPVESLLCPQYQPYVLLLNYPG